MVWLAMNSFNQISQENPAYTIPQYAGKTQRLFKYLSLGQMMS